MILSSVLFLFSFVCHIALNASFTEDLKAEREAELVYSKIAPFYLKTSIDVLAIPEDHFQEKNIFVTLITDKAAQIVARENHVSSAAMTFKATACPEAKTIKQRKHAILCITPQAYNNKKPHHFFETHLANQYQSYQIIFIKSVHYDQSSILRNFLNKRCATCQTESATTLHPL